MSPEAAWAGLSSIVWLGWFNNIKSLNLMQCNLKTIDNLMPFKIFRGWFNKSEGSDCWHMFRMILCSGWNSKLQSTAGSSGLPWKLPWKLCTDLLMFGLKGCIAKKFPAKPLVIFHLLTQPPCLSTGQQWGWNPHGEQEEFQLSQLTSTSFTSRQYLTIWDARDNSKSKFSRDAGERLTPTS